jgi:hypothetical protein
MRCNLLKRTNDQYYIIDQHYSGLLGIIGPSISELAGFCLGIDFLSSLPQGSTVQFFTDCQFVLSALRLNSLKTDLHVKCLRALTHYSKSLDISIDWSPKAANNTGLVVADHLAKIGRKNSNVKYPFLPSLQCLQSHLRRKSIEAWSSRYSTNTTGSNLKKIFPSLSHLRTITSKITLSNFNTAVLTGHGLLGSIQYKFGKTDDPYCRFCGERREDLEHLVYHCQSLTRERSEFFSASFLALPENLEDFSLNHGSVKVLLAWLQQILKPTPKVLYPN